jgi:ribonuclease J
MVSRGFVFEDHSAFILDEAKSLVLQVVNEIENRSHIDWAEVAPEIKKNLKRYFFNTIERRPLILPIIMPV